MSTLTERLLRIIQDKAHGKHTVFAKKAGIPTSTMHGYVKGRMPHVEHLMRIREIFRVNIDWLLTGEGDPYLLERGPGEVAEPPGVHNKDTVEAVPPDVALLLGKARQVLMGNDPVAREALEKNIIYFASKLDDGKKPAVPIEDRLTHLEETCEQIVGEVKAIKRKVNKVSSERMGGGELDGSSGSMAM